MIFCWRESPPPSRRREGSRPAVYWGGVDQPGNGMGSFAVCSRVYGVGAGSTRPADNHSQVIGYRACMVGRVPSRSGSPKKIRGGRAS